MGGDAADIDDVTTVARFHSLRHDLGQCNDREDVRLQHLLCVVEVYLVGGVNTQRKTRVVDEDIDLPELGRKRQDHSCELRNLANV